MSRPTKPHVTARPYESFESLMKRFKRAVDKSNILKDLREYEYYEKPSVSRKRKLAAAKKRWERKRQETALPVEHRPK